MTFTRAPKVLCLHLRRLVRGPTGEPVKSNCHVSFPLELDLTPYCSFACGAELEPFIIKKDIRTTEKMKKETEIENDAINQLINRKPFSGALKPRPSPQLSGLGGGSNYSQADTDLRLAKKRTDLKKEKEPRQVSSGSQMYQLVSVIVHHGSHLGGHYAVYRNLLTNPLRDSSSYDQFLKNSLVENSYLDNREWVYISDERVQPCSVTEVLKAQAYMLYYEKC